MDARLARCAACWARAFCLLLLAAAPAAAAFTEAQVRAIASHGPWPPAFKPDPSNRASGNREAIELGERLFFERRLSAGAAVSCSSWPIVVPA